MTLSQFGATRIPELWSALEWGLYPTISAGFPERGCASSLLRAHVLSTIPRAQKQLMEGLVWKHGAATARPRYR